MDVEFSRVALARRRELPGGGLLINDAWNANPVSMRAALEHLAEQRGRRTVAVLGEMAELGADAPRYHAEIGGAIARARDRRAWSAVGAARAARTARTTWVATAAEAARGRAPSSSSRATCVLVKGSRAVGLEVVADALAESPR